MRATSLAASLVTFDAAESPASRFTRTGRLAAAATLVLGAGFQLLAFSTMPEFDETLDRLRWISDHPARADSSKVFDVLAMPFLFGSAVVYVFLSRTRSPRLAWAGGILLGCGLVGLSAIQGLETLEFALTTDGGFDLAALATAVDDISTAPAIAMVLLFIGGAFFGLVITSIALWRSRAVPRGAVALIPAFIVVDLFLSQPREAHVISFIGASWIAWAVLRAGRVS